MTRLLGIPSLTFTFLALALGCADPHPDWKETYPVKGQVFADGKPAEGVSVTLNPKSGLDTKQPTISSTMTDAQGNFAISTYEEGDGAPEGEYTLTFKWGKLNRMSMSYSGDQFKGKYSDPLKSKFPLSVQPGSPIDMGKIELVTQ
ncbi:carboxypeptidase-like regulatory domain-containing protein [Aureliella helgolandensis]|uniref:Nickel uptake substrate-specific transmembrane region n=1 Tax=Aureliella helgolandensis TaxID=2527968 RepID=A0A518GGT8_9BACT|nr:carboxypeptidase-like regulatory domain-containing protein [Aureliella helgolandensis]QDV27811.1 Nickel uptake substrate-specific transmembrane region [Aureliella helgolandensis]